MNDQFTDLSIPDPNKSYYCYERLLASGFTYLMKLVLCVNKFPEAIKLIEEIIQDHPEEINKVNTHEISALMLACGNCNTHSNYLTIKLLIDAGADPNIQDYYGETALTLVDDNKIIKLLIDAGADVDLTSNNLDTPLMCYLSSHIFTPLDVDFLMMFIIKSKNSLHLTNYDGDTSYDIYIDKNINILDENQLRILKGETMINYTKRAI